MEAFEIFSQGEDLEGCGFFFLGEICWRSLRTCLILSLILVLHMVLDVTDVLVSLSFVVTEFCDGFFVLL